MPLFNLRPCGLYSRWRNVDRNGKPVKSGSMVKFGMTSLLTETVKLEYLPRLGWCYFSQKHGQHFVMPSEFYPPTRINVFHYCEVIS